MESVSGGPIVDPPWQLSDFFSEDGLRAAQEYYFQTHATNTRLIAAGRNAQGVAKSLTRRKLNKEMGEDFKMYTGANIGEGGGEDSESKGIRGELNDILKHIYTRIAPQTPITSPIQEDLTILKHPQGGLEVCYAMVFFYGSLMRKYASLATNRRVVLRSIMDEEFFKWIWRMVIAYMMAPAKSKSSIEDPFLTAGITVIPVEQQRVPLGQKINEIGMFLLSKSMKESRLRAPICHYFVIYLRQMQAHLLLNSSRKEVDTVYKTLTSRGVDSPIDHPLVAVDALMNNKGNSMDSFDDVLKDGAQIKGMIPAAEADFINQFEDFGNPKRLATTLRRMVPDPRKEPEENQASTLMPLTLMLRTMPATISELVLARMPVPLLNMVRNRIINSRVDEIGKEMLDRIKSYMDMRRESGETYTLSGGSASKAAVAATVRPAKPKSTSEPTAKATADTTATPAATGAAPAEGASPQSPASGAAPAPDTAGAAPAGAPVDIKAVLYWTISGGGISAVAMSAADVMSLAGKELRVLLPWVVFSMRTGQVFGMDPEKLSREVVEKKLRELVGDPRTDNQGSLPREQVVALVEKTKGKPMNQVLMNLAKAGGVENYSTLPSELSSNLDSLKGKLGVRLGEFLDNPGDDSFRELRSGLTEEEKLTLTLFNRVARAQ